jgi:hypothetical protein
VVDRGDPEASCSEWHGDGTASEDDAFSHLAMVVPAWAMGEVRPGRHRLVGKRPGRAAASQRRQRSSSFRPLC